MLSAAPMSGGLTEALVAWLLRLAAVAVLAALQACVVVPRTTEVYDPDCRVMARTMDLEAVQIAAIRGCTDRSCGALLAAAGATAAASAVISGSIVIVGNVVYWFEKQGRCQRDTPP
ncbi:hypothetical protein AACH06_28040 [Ideonella sp. DXS29W]|uniref:Uncharacterized protein n=1 Tax=Ideonella lacteola TaxID=2984193 RepID=A0ABU9BXQ9_9BURK